MILLVCTDDNQVRAAARQLSGNHPAVYGAWATIGDVGVGQLAGGEDLFVSGYGTTADPTTPNAVPTIGNRAGAYRFTAVELWQVVGEMDVVPDGWTGRVFVWAYQAADENPVLELSFAEMLRTQVDLAAPGNRGVWARSGAHDPGNAPLGHVSIPRPDDDRWVRAT